MVVAARFGGSAGGLRGGGCTGGAPGPPGPGLASALPARPGPSPVPGTRSARRQLQATSSRRCPQPAPPRVENPRRKSYLPNANGFGKKTTKKKPSRMAFVDPSQASRRGENQRSAGKEAPCDFRAVTSRVGCNMSACGSPAAARAVPGRGCEERWVRGLRARGILQSAQT